MENTIERRLLRVITKIEVKQIEVWEEGETDFRDMGKKDEAGDTIYGYIPTGKPKKVEVSTNLYEQKFDEGCLDVRELALHLNRVR